MCVHACVFVCVYGICVHVGAGAHACAHMEVRGGYLLSCSMTLWHIPLRQGLSLNLGLGWQPAPWLQSVQVAIPGLFSGSAVNLNSDPYS